MQNVGARAFVACLLALSSGACVHASVERTGRERLLGGNEGFAPILAELPAGFVEVALVTVEAGGISTYERLSRHLQRRASLLGCEGLVKTNIRPDHGAEGTCVRRQDPAPKKQPTPAPIIDTVPDDLIKDAKDAGAEGVALLEVLEQVKDRPVAQRAWPLRWFVQNHPTSRFRARVEALLAPPIVATTMVAGAGR